MQLLLELLNIIPPCLGLGPFDRLSAAQYCRSLTLKAPCDNFTYCCTSSNQRESVFGDKTSLVHPERSNLTCQASEVILEGGDSIFSALTECLYRALAMGNPA
uniref:Uncharacterized protein n=1 Tax=Utricularia reniformis TaxID=192314 RepID=A0A1Y0AZE7_9LAMI|nr:hypothetical protein AEK19_MT0280 [Utricularia reniformis]ART30556.1 hypothetical protein AEK19_MT0280 [Utricularia reniformis]